MINLILAAAALIIITISALTAYVLGLTKNIRSSEQYKAGLASGYRKGRIEGETERDRLQAELDQRNTDLEEIGALYDRRLARFLTPVINRAVSAVYDHQEDGL